jgi:hypothetical protein
MIKMRAQVMETDTAIELISQLAYKPGWVFEASDHCHRFEGTIILKVSYPAHETAREKARDGYPDTNQPHATFPIQVHRLDATELYRAVLNVIAEIDSHEAREYLRVSPTYWAPFHPHNIDGMERWGTPERDLTFGLA